MARRGGGPVGEVRLAAGRGHTFARVSREGVGVDPPPLPLEPEPQRRPEARGGDSLIARAVQPGPPRARPRPEEEAGRRRPRRWLGLAALILLVSGLLVLAGAWQAGWLVAWRGGPAGLTSGRLVGSTGQPRPSGEELPSPPAGQPPPVAASPAAENGTALQEQVARLLEEVQGLRRERAELQTRIGAGRQELAELGRQIAARRSELAAPARDQPAPAAPAAGSPVAAATSPAGAAPPAIPFPKRRPDQGP
jgi:hypothetical protein